MLPHSEEHSPRKSISDPQFSRNLSFAFYWPLCCGCARFEFQFQTPPASQNLHRAKAHRHLDHQGASQGPVEGLCVSMAASSSYSSLQRTGLQIRYFRLLCVDEKSRSLASYRFLRPEASQNVFVLAFSMTGDRCASGLCRLSFELYLVLFGDSEAFTTAHTAEKLGRQNREPERQVCRSLLL